MTENKGLYSIGMVERDTGIGRDTLRVWERRYGFPKPVRNDKGERVYPEDQLRRLQRIRRLLDQGLRPGKILALDEQALDDVEAGLQPTATGLPDKNIAAMLEAIRSTDAGKVQQQLQAVYAQQGMEDFILKTVAPLITTVGDNWMAGKLQVFQEHFISQQLIRFLNTEITRMQVSTKKPRVLLATLPGEEHTLGLLMVAAMLSLHGVSTINLGAEVPMDQISLASKQFHTDIVGITFSGAYQYRNIRTHLQELRELMPDNVDIWTGGEGVHRLRKLPDGVTKFTSLEHLPI